MGNQNSSVEDSNEFRYKLADYQFYKKFLDARLGEIKILKNKYTNVGLIEKTLSAGTAQLYEAYVQKIKEHSTWTHANILKLFGYTTRKEEFYCSDFYKLNIYLEFFETDLDQELALRKTANELFPEVELWYILDSVISALAYLQVQKTSHGDIKPFNVLILGSEYKICDSSLLITSAKPGLFSFVDDSYTKNHYPGPQAFSNLKNEVDSKPYSQIKNDIFSLGLTILEAAILTKMDTVYKWSDLTIDQEKIDEYLKEAIKLGYSPELIDVLNHLLINDEDVRPDAITLDNELDPWRKYIRARLPIPRQEPVIEETSQKDYEDFEAKVRAAVEQTGITMIRANATDLTNKVILETKTPILNPAATNYTFTPVQTIPVNNVPDIKYDLPLNSNDPKRSSVIDDLLNKYRTDDSLKQSFTIEDPSKYTGYPPIANIGTTGYNYQPIDLKFNYPLSNHSSNYLPNSPPAKEEMKIDIPAYSSEIKAFDSNTSQQEKKIEVIPKEQAFAQNYESIIHFNMINKLDDTEALLRKAEESLRKSQTIVR